MLVFEEKKIKQFLRTGSGSELSEKTDSNICLCLDVCFLQAIALCEVVDLVAALIAAVVIDPHGDRVNLCPARADVLLFPVPFLILLERLFIFSFSWKDDLCKGGKKLQLFRLRGRLLLWQEKIELSHCS